jgi:hypothetical protein
MLTLSSKSRTVAGEDACMNAAFCFKNYDQRRETPTRSLLGVTGLSRRSSFVAQSKRFTAVWPFPKRYTIFPNVCTAPVADKVLSCSHLASAAHGLMVRDCPVRTRAQFLANHIT